MVSVHPYQDISCKAGTGCNTTTAIYKAVYLSDDNTVAVIDTITNFSKFAGILQDYANTTGANVTVRTTGVSKAKMGYVDTSTSYIAVGDWVKPDVVTTTAQGNLVVATATVAEFGTGGSCFILGKAVGGLTRTTLTSTIQDTIFEVEILPQVINRCAATTTI